MKLAAVVLAAGKSERMGRNKLLLELAGRSILDRLLDTLDDSKLVEVYVVLGHQPEKLKPIVDSHRAQSILNRDFEDGMISSIKAGLEYVSADAVYLVLGDHPVLMVDLMERMAEKMFSNLSTLVVSPLYNGKRGHPILFRRELIPEILTLDEGETLNDLILRYEESHEFVEGSFWSTFDIDAPEDFERAKRLFEKKFYDDSQ